MDMMQAMAVRHSVRHFNDEPLKKEDAEKLQAAIDAVNQESGLCIQLFVNEPEAFAANETSYGQFAGCRNYMVMVGPRGRDEEIGYYGEKLVLTAQCLGINSCWVAMTYKKRKAQGNVPAGMKRYLVIALGYGKTQGVSHKVKALSEISDYRDSDPEWYKKGLEGALLAPTAMNQQKFTFARSGEKVTAKAGMGFYTKIDLGIAKYHFALASGRGPEVFAEE